jgi:hypothetical protein
MIHPRSDHQRYSQSREPAPALTAETLVAFGGPALRSAFCVLVNPSLQEEKEAGAHAKATVAAVALVALHSVRQWSWSVGNLLQYKRKAGKPLWV